ncbi:MAG: DUF4234 domain-containing protein [Desulfobacteraceae bacterium]|nr:DUF4234 domain-containing protein [Desulfobacteraceae bacterium]
MNQIMKRESSDRSKHDLSIALYLILTLITCGLFNLYWNYKQMEGCNYLLNRQEFRFVYWLLFSILTCGLYHIFYQYKMGSAIVEIQQNTNKAVFDSLPILSCLVTIFGLSIVVDCIHQYEINKILN